MKKHLWDGNISPRLSISSCLSSQYKDACSACHIFGSIRCRRHAISISLHGILEEFKSEVECQLVELYRDSVVVSCGGFLAFSSGRVWEKTCHFGHVGSTANTYCTFLLSNVDDEDDPNLDPFPISIRFLPHRKKHVKITQNPSKSIKTTFGSLTLAALIPFLRWGHRSLHGWKGTLIASIADNLDRWDEQRGVTWRGWSYCYLLAASAGAVWWLGDVSSTCLSFTKFQPSLLFFRVWFQEHGSNWLLDYTLVFQRPRNTRSLFKGLEHILQRVNRRIFGRLWVLLVDKICLKHLVQVCVHMKGETWSNFCIRQPVGREDFMKEELFCSRSWYQCPIPNGESSDFFGSPEFSLPLGFAVGGFRWDGYLTDPWSRMDENL